MSPTAYLSRRSRTSAVTALACLAFAAACTQGVVGQPGTHANRTTPPSTSHTYLGIRVEPVAPTHAHALDPPVAGFLAASTAPDRIWIGSAHGLAWLDPDDGTTHLVDGKPGVGLAVAGHELYRAAWAGNDVSRYDISDGQAREVARAPAPSPLYIAVSAGGLWAADHDHGRLLRLDPRTLRITKRVTIGSGAGLGTAGMVWLGGHLWVVSKRDKSLYEVDGRTGRPVSRVDLGGPVGDDITLTHAGIWAEVDVNSDDHPVYCLVDPRRHQVVAHVNVREAANITKDTAWMIAAPIVVGEQLWIAVDRYLVRLDPDGGWKPDRVLELPTPITARFALSAFGSVWIYSAHPEPSVIRVDGAALA